MPMKPIKRKNVTEEIFQQMMELIISGEWKSGCKIPAESELTEIVGVSRIAVREALQKLTALGLIETRPGSGTYVKEPSADLYANLMIPLLILSKPSIIHVMEFRKAIESENAKLAAERANEEEINALQQIIIEMENAVGDSKEYAEKDLAFHLELANITKNPLTYKVCCILKDIMKNAMKNSTDMRGFSGLDEHKEILEAIRNKKPQVARRIMRKHIDYTLVALQNSVKDGDI